MRKKLYFILQNPISMVAFSVALSGIGFATGKTATLMTAWNAGKSLQASPDLGKNRNLFLLACFFTW